MKFRLSSEYGELSLVRDGKPHTGIDLAMTEGTTLRSLTNGVVEKVYDGSGKIGEGVKIRLDDGTFHIFGHMDEVTVKKGQLLQAGQVIGESGNTGHSTAPHLHFAVQQADGSFVNPTPLATDISALSGTQVGFFRSLADKYNSFADWTVNKELEWLFKPIVNGFGKAFIHLGDWFVLNLPDIMGYTTVGAGVFIILSSMVGKSDMMKTLGWYFAAMILAICILGGV
jgi:uncharacterized protein YwbE